MLYQSGKIVPQVSSKVNMLLCRIDTCSSFWFTKYMIGVWATDLFPEIFSTTKLIGWVENSVSKWKHVLTT